MSTLTFTSIVIEAADLGGVGDLPLIDVLPYHPRSSYNRVPVQRATPVAVLENEHLRAVFLMEWGGRLWSLVDLHTGRETLHSPRVLQPANLALRGAWFAGGVEWNLGVRGHWGLTCEPVLSGRVETSAGHPVLRMWEYERLLGLVWRVDAWLPDGSRSLFVRPVVSNHTDQTVDVYWWSNAAVPQTAGTRVVVPADSAINFGATGVASRVNVPDAEGVAVDRPASIRRAEDYFFEIAEQEPRPWIATLDANGLGLGQVSTRRLRGRKLFVWGDSVGGRHWQRWLSGDDGDYLEIQAGLALTQFDDEPLAPGESWSWTEAYAAVRVPTRVAGSSWTEAVQDVGSAVDAVATRGQLDAAHDAATAWQDVAPVEVHRAPDAGGWGALEVGAGHLAADPATPFPVAALGAEQAPWLELATNGRLPLGAAPAATIGGERWRRRLEGHAQSWHDWLQLGYLRLDVGDRDAAVDAFSRSLALAVTPWARRALAMVAASQSDVVAAADLSVAAQQSLPESIQLLTETLEILAAAGEWTRLLAVIDGAPAASRVIGRVRYWEARAAIRVAAIDRAAAIIDDGIEIPDVREGAQLFDTLWSEWCAATGSMLPIPEAWDFRMFAER